jgi:hypothetical protein
MRSIPNLRVGVQRSSLPSDHRASPDPVLHDPPPRPRVPAPDTSDTADVVDALSGTDEAVPIDDRIGTGLRVTLEAMTTRTDPAEVSVRHDPPVVVHEHPHLSGPRTIPALDEQPRRRHDRRCHRRTGHLEPDVAALEAPPQEAGGGVGLSTRPGVSPHHGGLLECCADVR